MERTHRKTMVHERAERWTGLRSERGEALREASSEDAERKVSAHEFYGEYHGHRIEHLHKVHTQLRCSQAGRSVIFLCGDSTLDNKYWLPGIATSRAVNGFEQVLDPPVMQADVAYWVNKELVERGVGGGIACLNCSIEESTLGERDGGRLMAQDQFIRDHLQPNDVLVTSLGGNDVALRPTIWTILSIASLLSSPRWMIEAGIAPGLGHFTRLFGSRTQKFAQQLCSACPEGGPRCVVVCMLYYLDMAQTPSWAARTLSLLGYDKDPTKLQLLIRKAYELATTRIKIDGTDVIPLPLFEALDGSNPKDYVQRVEPSSSGGKKMARAILDGLAKHGLEIPLDRS